MERENGYYWMRKGLGDYIPTYYEAGPHLWLVKGEFKHLSESDITVGERIPSNEELKELNKIKEDYDKIIKSEFPYND